MKMIEILSETPIMVPANDMPQPMSRAVREMLHALCRITGTPYQPGQSQDVALRQIDRLRDQLEQQKNA